MDLDELDIYDDLDTFQKDEEKKSTELLALESKYNESMKANETLQLENADLKKQIKMIGINFQNLLDTAKAEIKRKDKQIEQLRKEKDDICFRRKQPHSVYDRETAVITCNTDNWHKKDQIFSTNDYKADLDVESNATLHAGHARDPRMRDEHQKYVQRDGKSERKHSTEMQREFESGMHAQKDQHVSRLSKHCREREEVGRSAKRNHSRESWNAERGHWEERERVREHERRNERDHREVRNTREERERKVEQDRRSERDNRSLRYCSTEKHKHSYNNSKHEGNDRRHNSHDKIGEHIRHTSKEDKSRSNTSEGRRESCNDYKQIPEDANKRSKNVDSKSLDKMSSNATNKRTNNLDNIKQHEDTRAKSKAANTNNAKVKHIEEAVLLSKDVENSRFEKNSNGMQTTNKNNLLCNKLPTDKDTLNLNDKSIANNNSLTKEKLVALEEQFNDKDIDPVFKCTFPLDGMITPKKAALFNSLFGSTPSNAENVNNALLNDVMVLLKNNSYSANISPSNCTDASGEQPISQTMKNNTGKSDIDECFVLNKGCEQKLVKNSQTATGVPDKTVEGELVVQKMYQAEGGSAESDKTLENVYNDKSAPIILLSDDDEDEIDVIAVNNALCIEESKNNLLSVERVGGTSKGEIKILENIRLPNIYEIRAQQRRLREEAANNLESNKLAMVNHNAFVKKPAKLAADEKTKEGKNETENCKIAAHKDADLKHCSVQNTANAEKISSADGSNNSTASASKQPISTENDDEIKNAAGKDKGNLIAENDGTNVKAVKQIMNSAFEVETKDSNIAEKCDNKAIKPTSIDLTDELEVTIDKAVKQTLSSPFDAKTKDSNTAVKINIQSIKPTSIDLTDELEVTIDKAVKQTMSASCDAETKGSNTAEKNNIQSIKTTSIDLTEELEMTIEKAVKQNMPSSFDVETKDSNKAEKNDSEAIKSKSNDIADELEMTIEKSINPIAATDIQAEMRESERQSKADAIVDNKKQSSCTEEASIIAKNNVVEQEENQSQIITADEYKISQKSADDKKIEMEVDLTTDAEVEEVTYDEQSSATANTTNATTTTEQRKSEDELIEITSTMTTNDNNHSENSDELSDDEETNTKAQEETDIQMKNIPKSSIKNDGGSTNNSIEKVSNEGKPAESREPTAEQKDAAKQNGPSELEFLDENCTENSTEIEIEASDNKDKCTDAGQKENSSKEAGELVSPESPKINKDFVEENMEDSNSMNEKPRENLLDLNKTQLSHIKDINEKTENITALKQSDLHAQTTVKEQDFKNVDVENNEKSELKDNQAQNSSNQADRELEDAVAYLVNTMHLENKYYSDEEIAKDEQQCKKNKKSLEINEPKTVVENSKENEHGASEKNRQESKLDLEDAKNMKLSRNASLKLFKNAEQELSQNTELKLLPGTAPELSKNAYPELSKHANAKPSENEEPEVSHNAQLKLIPNATPKVANNSNLELSQHANLKLLNNAEDEDSQSTKVQLLPNVVTEHTKKNAIPEISKNKNRKFVNNAELEPLKKKERKVSNASPDLTKNTNLEHFKNPNTHHLQTANLKISPTPSLSTERNVLVDNMKRSEILWKFKIPKLSAKRKRENSDETSKANDTAVNGEITADEKMKNVTTNDKTNQDDKSLKQQVNPYQEISLINKKSTKGDNHFEDKNLYLMPDEIGIVDDIELIETRLLTGQTPEEKRTLSADREKSERIIKEIDNWARRTVGEIPDIIESALLFETANIDTVKINESIEEIPKTSENTENKKAKDDRKSTKSAKAYKADPKMELKNSEKAYAPLLTLKLCEQHEKENEKQLANRASGLNYDIKTEQFGHLPSKRGKYENATDRKVAETQVKHKTDTQKRGADRKTDSKAQRISYNNTKEKVGGVGELKSNESRAYDTANKTGKNVKQAMEEENASILDANKVSVTSSPELIDELKAEKQNEEIINKKGIKKSQTEVSKTTVERENTSIISKLKEDASREAKTDGIVIQKLKEQKENDRKACATLKRTGDVSKTNLSISTEDTESKEKRVKVDAKKNVNAQTTSTNAKKQQVPSTQATKAAISAANSTNSPNHSTKAIASIDKPIETIRNIQTHKRQRSVSDSDKEEIEEVMPKPRKRKRCEMRIEDSDEDECQQTPSKTTENKDILAILQNDSVNGNNDSNGGSILPGPQTPSSLPADISQDEQYTEIDTRMQLMFASPKTADKTAARDLRAKASVAIKEPAAQLMALAGAASIAQAATQSPIDTAASAPLKVASPLAVTHTASDLNLSDTCFSDFNSNSFQVSSRNITIDETQDNEMDTSMNSSTLSDSSSTKHISLGSSDYRFEKVSDNVVNLFITRKRRGKRKATTAAGAAAGATTTKTNTIKTAT